MCGISGYTHLRRCVSPAVIRQATDCLVHRGPDQQGTYESKDVSLGAVRLKIIDLTAGDQPMVSEDGRAVLVFNGEIYNHRELRAHLEQYGHRFSTHCDTEVFLQAFLHWDVDCFCRMRGMFAAAIWLEDDKRLVLARDRMGIKPLYISRRGRDVYFGSELKSLFVHEEIERELDLSALHYYLALNYVPGPHSLLKGIEKLPPAHWMEWKDGRTKTGHYWKPRYEVDERWNLDTAAEALDQLLKDSIREQLVAEVPVGVWLSGGVDSSTILHQAREVSSAKLKTFSIGFRGRSFDETSYGREVAARYGAEHCEFDLNPGLDLSGEIEKMIPYLDEPMADSGAVPLWFLSRISRQNVTVALSGEGADELFGGYITYRADKLAGYARRVPRRLRHSLLRLLQYWPASDEKIGADYKVKRFLEGTFLPEDEAHTYWNGAFSRAQQGAILCAGNHASVQDLYQSDLPPAKYAGCLSRYLAFDQRYYLADDLLQKVDRMSMAHAVEVRPPYLDHRIVEFSATLPEKMKVNGRKQKVVLKKLMKDRLPEIVLKRSKNGLDIPTHDWFRGPLRTLLMDTLSEKAIEDTGLFHNEAIQQLISDHLERRCNAGFHLWVLLVLFLWIREWKIQTIAEPEPVSLAVSAASSRA